MVVRLEFRRYHGAGDDKSYENKIDDPLAAAFSGISACEQAIGPLKMDFKQIKKAIREQTGIPVPVARADKE